MEDLKIKTPLNSSSYIKFESKLFYINVFYFYYYLIYLIKENFFVDNYQDTINYMGEICKKSGKTRDQFLN